MVIIEFVMLPVCNSSYHDFCMCNYYLTFLNLIISCYNVCSIVQYVVLLQCSIVVCSIVTMWYCSDYKVFNEIIQGNVYKSLRNITLLQKLWIDFRIHGYNYPYKVDLIFYIYHLKLLKVLITQNYETTNFLMMKY